MEEKEEDRKVSEKVEGKQATAPGGDSATETAPALYLVTMDEKHGFAQLAHSPFLDLLYCRG